MCLVTHISILLIEFLDIKFKAMVN